jgi:2-amino-4-hydroxy-6-hydroxymethyldihydropteridine diphosphokinase
LTRVVAAIALGSNLGDRERHLRRALIALERTPGVVLLRRSTWHETEPVGGPVGQGPYLNGAALLETSLQPAELLERLQEIESDQGRERGELNGARTLDLDLLWFGEQRSDDPHLTLPHPRMEQRPFVLAPLAELVPEHTLAGCGLTVIEQLARLEDGP